MGYEVYSSPVRTAESQDNTLTIADKARNIKVLRAFLLLFRKQRKPQKSPEKTKFSYKFVTEKRSGKNCNDFWVKRLILYLLSLKCLLRF